MADTSTTHYDFTKPEIGGSEDTWGQKLNDNFDALDAMLYGESGVLGAPVFNPGYNWPVFSFVAGANVDSGISIGIHRPDEVGDGNLGWAIQRRGANENDKLQFRYEGSVKFAISTGGAITDITSINGVTFGGGADAVFRDVEARDISARRVTVNGYVRLDGDGVAVQAAGGNNLLRREGGVDILGSTATPTRLAGQSVEIAGPTTVDNTLRVESTNPTGVIGRVNPNGPAGKVEMGSESNHDVNLVRSGTDKLVLTSYGGVFPSSIVWVANNASPDYDSGPTIGVRMTENGIDVKAQGSDDQTKQLIRVRKGSSGTNFAIQANGDVKNSNNSYGSLSDARLKEDVTDAAGQLADLLLMRVVNYKMTSDPEGKKQIGLIAQELQQIKPGLVDEDEDGFLSIKYSVLVPVMVKAMQELSSEVEQVKARLAALEEAAL